MIDLCSHIGIVRVVINYLLFYRYIQCFTIENVFQHDFNSVCDTMEIVV